MKNTLSVKNLNCDKWNWRYLTRLTTKRSRRACEDSVLSKKSNKNVKLSWRAFLSQKCGAKEYWSLFHKMSNCFQSILHVFNCCLDRSIKDNNKHFKFVQKNYLFSTKNKIKFNKLFFIKSLSNTFSKHQPQDHNSHVGILWEVDDHIFRHLLSFSIRVDWDLHLYIVEKKKIN